MRASLSTWPTTNWPKMAPSRSFRGSQLSLVSTDTANRPKMAPEAPRLTLTTPLCTAGCKRTDAMAAPAEQGVLLLTRVAWHGPEPCNPQKGVLTTTTEGRFSDGLPWWTCAATYAQGTVHHCSTDQHVGTTAGPPGCMCTHVEQVCQASRAASAMLSCCTFHPIQTASALVHCGILLCYAVLCCGCAHLLL
jgi:hypothetical protein